MSGERLRLEAVIKEALAEKKIPRKFEMLVGMFFRAMGADLTDEKMRAVLCAIRDEFIPFVLDGTVPTLLEEEQEPALMSEHT
jgi:hypothetical protein